MSKEGIHVFVRVRPPISDDLSYDTAVFANENNVQLSDKKYNVSCAYEHVFPETSTQEDVFNTVQPLLGDVLNGFNGCIFAYGQTSAGKTHTMLGSNGGQMLSAHRYDWGILPRSAEYLFNELQRKERAGVLSFCVKCSFLQIYNECIYDLLSSSSTADTGGGDEEDVGRGPGPGLKIREVAAAGTGTTVPGHHANRKKSKRHGDSSGGEVYVSGLSEFRVHSASDVIRLLTVGANNRATRATAFNESSSRSHAILTLSFEIESQAGGSSNKTITRSKLNVVDLAGSEKMSSSIGLGGGGDPNSFDYGHYSGGMGSGIGGGAESAADARHVKELTNINKSLHALGNVIATLSSKGYRQQQQQGKDRGGGDEEGTTGGSGRNAHVHVPYRDSKLTRLLQDSLGGNCRTMLVACVAPTQLHSAETLSTLQFADRAKSVMVRVQANVVVDDKALLARAQAEIIRLKMLLRQALQRCGSRGGGSDLSFELEAEDEGGQVGDERDSGGAAAESRVGEGGRDVARLVHENEQLRRENERLHEQLMGSLDGRGGKLSKDKKKRMKQLQHKQQKQQMAYERSVGRLAEHQLYYAQEPTLAQDEPALDKKHRQPNEDPQVESRRIKDKSQHQHLHQQQQQQQLSRAGAASFDIRRSRVLPDLLQFSSANNGRLQAPPAHAFAYGAGQGPSPAAAAAYEMLNLPYPALPQVMQRQQLQQPGSAVASVGFDKQSGMAGSPTKTAPSPYTSHQQQQGPRQGQGRSHSPIANVGSKSKTQPGTGDGQHQRGSGGRNNVEDEALAVSRLRAKLNRAKTLQQGEALDRQLDAASNLTASQLAAQEAELRRIQQMKKELEDQLGGMGSGLKSSPGGAGSAKSSPGKAKDAQQTQKLGPGPIMRATSSLQRQSKEEHPAPAAQVVNVQFEGEDEASAADDEDCSGGEEEEDEYGEDSDFAAEDEDEVPPGQIVQKPKASSPSKHQVAAATVSADNDDDADGDSSELERRLGEVLAKQFSQSVGDNAAALQDAPPPVTNGGLPKLPPAPKEAPAAGDSATTPAGLSYSKADVGRRVLMFSFRLNTWEPVSVTDFEPNRGLHKISPEGGSGGPAAQWVDLRKKPVKSCGQ